MSVLLSQEEKEIAGSCVYLEQTWGVLRLCSNIHCGQPVDNGEQVMETSIKLWLRTNEDNRKLFTVGGEMWLAVGKRSCEPPWFPGSPWKPVSKQLRHHPAQDQSDCKNHPSTNPQRPMLSGLNLTLKLASMVLCEDAD